MLEIGLKHKKSVENLDIPSSSQRENLRSGVFNDEENRELIFFCTILFFPFFVVADTQTSLALTP